MATPTFSGMTTAVFARMCYLSGKYPAAYIVPLAIRGDADLSAEIDGWITRHQHLLAKLAEQARGALAAMEDASIAITGAALSTF